MIKIEVSTKQLFAISENDYVGFFGSTDTNKTYEEAVEFVKENFSHITLADLLDSDNAMINISDMNESLEMMKNIGLIKSQMFIGDTDLAHSLMDLILSNGDVLSQMEEDKNEITSEAGIHEVEDMIELIQLTKKGLDSDDYDLAHSVLDYLVNNKGILSQLEYQILIEEGEIVHVE